MSTETDTAVLEAETSSRADHEVIAPPSHDTRLVIEPATWDHAPKIVEILRSSAEWYEDIVAPEDLSEHFVDMDWARENMDRRDFFVGRVDGEVAGTLSLQKVGDDALYLGYVYLHTDHVGNGYGEDLLDFARMQAKKQGRTSMVLIAHPEAVWARKAYLRYGFEIVARKREDVLAWHGGWLEQYYEEGFELYRYELQGS